MSAVFVLAAGIAFSGIAPNTAAALDPWTYTAPMSMPTALGGRMVAVDIDPTSICLNVGTCSGLAASEAGGLFKTNDYGQHWYHLDSLPVLYMGDVRYEPDNVFFPNADRVVLATVTADTRRADASSNPANYAGIWRSADGGETWQQVGQDLSPLGPCGNRSGAYGIAWAPQGNGWVWVGTDCGLAFSSDRGLTWTVTDVNGSVTPDGVYSVAANKLEAGTVDACGPSGYWHHTYGLGPWVNVPLPKNQGCNNRVHAVDSVSINVAGGRYEAVYVTPDDTDLYEYVQPVGNPNWGAAAFRSIGKIQTKNGRPSFVRVYPRNVYGPSDPLGYDVYYTNAGSVAEADFFLDRPTFRPLMWRLYCSASRPCANKTRPLAWHRIADHTHPDITDLAIPALTRCPFFVASDGGIGQLERAPCATDGHMVGGTGGGMNALQFYDVAGPPTDYQSETFYAGTQDNRLWRRSGSGWSSWSNEGGYFEVPDNSSLPGRPIFYGNESANGLRYKFSTNLLSFDAYDEKDSIGSCRGPKTLVTETSSGSKWLRAKFCGTPRVDTLQIFTLPGDASRTLRFATPFPQIWDKHPQVIVRAGVPTAFFAVVNGSAVGLARVDGILTSTPSWQMIPLATNMSVGIQSGFGWNDFTALFAVDPFDTDHIVVADRNNQAIQVTWDGGLNWTTDTQLTGLITQQARPFGTIGGKIQTRFISFDRNQRDRIFVGTEAAGALASSDGGETWTIVPGSERIPLQTDIYTRPDAPDSDTDRNVLATYARGLWNMDFPRNDFDLSMSVDTNQVGPGESTKVHISLTNNGSTTARFPTVVFRIVDPFTASGAALTCGLPTLSIGHGLASDAVACYMGEIAPGDTATADITVRASLFASPGAGALFTIRASDPLSTDRTTNFLFGRLSIS